MKKQIEKERNLEAARVLLNEARDMIAVAARKMREVSSIDTQIEIADKNLALALCDIIDIQDGKVVADDVSERFIEVLRKCKLIEGRTYKYKIVAAWQTGNYGALKGWECELQQMRNTLGPAWLEGVRV